MRVLHIYSKADGLIAQHVKLLADGMRHSLEEVVTADSASNLRQLIIEHEPDILHCHGCSLQKLARAARTARHRGARVVVTPHGQLEPWVLSQQPVHEKVTNALLWQKETITSAYAIITLGKSNTLEQLDETSRKALATIIKAGIMGDRRWCLSLGSVNNPQQIDWRRLLVYAEHENIRNYVDYGINVLDLPTPAIDTERIAAYFPDTYTRPRPLKEIIGDYQGDETAYLMKMITKINKQPLLLHLIELTRELYRDTVNDDLLRESDACAAGADRTRRGLHAPRAKKQPTHAIYSQTDQ